MQYVSTPIAKNYEKLAADVRFREFYEKYYLTKFVTFHMKLLPSTQIITQRDESLFEQYEQMIAHLGLAPLSDVNCVF